MCLVMREEEGEQSFIQDDGSCQSTNENYFPRLLTRNIDDPNQTLSYNTVLVLHNAGHLNQGLSTENNNNIVNTINHQHI